MVSTRRALQSSVVSLAAAAFAVVVAASPAAAHTGAPSDGVADGVLHPITGIDHLLAMLAVGVVAATAVTGRRRWLTPVAFAGGMLVGGIAGMVGVPFPGAEVLILASVLLLGLAVAGAVRGAGDGLLLALVVAGVAHGHAHGAEAPSSVHPLTYVGGFLLATASLHLLGAGVGTAIRERGTLRVGLGAATVAAGVLLAA